LILVSEVSQRDEHVDHCNIYWLVRIFRSKLVAYLAHKESLDTYTSKLQPQFSAGKPGTFSNCTLGTGGLTAHT